MPEPVTVTAVVVGMLLAGAATVATQLTAIIDFFRRLRDWRVARYLKHLDRLLQVWNRQGWLSDGDIRSFREFLGKAQQADYKGILEGHGQQRLLEQAEEMEDEMRRAGVIVA